MSFKEIANRVIFVFGGLLTLGGCILFVIKTEEGLLPYAGLLAALVGVFIIVKMVKVGLRDQRRATEVYDVID